MYTPYPTDDTTHPKVTCVNPNHPKPHKRDWKCILPLSIKYNRCLNWVNLREDDMVCYLKEKHDGKCEYLFVQGDLT